MIKRIVLAGGPCGGKSTALLEVPKRLPYINFILKPEAASIVLAEDGGWNKDTQDKIFLKQVALEKKAMAEAMVSSHSCNVILYDRGFLDQKVYATPNQWRAMSEAYKRAGSNINDRYDYVIYLHSVARGKPELYSNETNPNRTGNADRAAHICRKTEEAWSDHPSMVVVDNASDMKGKIDWVVWHIIQMVAE